MAEAAAQRIAPGAAADVASGAAQAGAPAVEISPREATWPSVHSRRRTAQEPASVVDPADATAWSMPYTDLTMLLMVFFIVMLSLVGPDPSETSEIENSPNAEATAAAMERARSQNPLGPYAADSPIDGRDGILPDGAGILPASPRAPEPAQENAARDMPEAETAAETETQQPRTEPPTPPDATAKTAQTDAMREMPDEAFAAAWARRVDALEDSAAAFLERAGLQDTISLNRTDLGIELRLPDDHLFDSGSADVQTDGMELLARVATFLEEVDGDIQVSGHTDDVPIRTVRVPSNWELSAARAISVVRLLRQMGIAETKMQAVGHGANRPIASNSHAIGRSINRRVTIDVTPRPGAS